LAGRPDVGPGDPPGSRRGRQAGAPSATIREIAPEEGPALVARGSGAVQAGRADLSLTVPIPVGEGFNFAAGAAMIDCGRRTARERLPQIRLAMQQVLAPGVP